VTANASVTVPIYTKIGEPITVEEAEALGFIHLGDARVDVPLTFDAPLPFEEVQGEIGQVGDLFEHGEFSPAQTIGDALGPHHAECGVLSHLHGEQCHPRCPTCYTFKHSTEGPYLVSPHNPANKPCVCGSDTPWVMGPNHADNCPMLFKRRSGMGVTVPDAPSPAPGPVAPEVSQ
jgi:hypothetical protein